MLLAGVIFTKHCYNSAPRARRVRVTNDFDALIWEDPDKRKEPNRNAISCMVLFVKMKISSVWISLLRYATQNWFLLTAIKEIVPGACTPQLQRKMFGHKQAAPECSFGVYFRSAYTSSYRAPSVLWLLLWVDYSANGTPSISPSISGPGLLRGYTFSGMMVL